MNEKDVVKTSFIIYYNNERRLENVRLYTE